MTAAGCNTKRRPRVAFVTSHPIQYQVPVFRDLTKRDGFELQVLFAMLPDAAAQGAGFGVAFEWDVPLLDGYSYRVLKNVARRPSVTRFGGCDTPDVAHELKRLQVDAVVVNGWVVKTCLQTLVACKRLGIPCIVRGEANNLRPRPRWKRLVQRQLVRRFDAYLPIGRASREFYRNHGIRDAAMFDAPYCVENDRFQRAAEAAAGHRDAYRSQWNIPADAVCFVFCGKFEPKKHPYELLLAFERSLPASPQSHLLMVGDGALRHQCQQYALSRSLPVTFAGFLNQSQIVGAYIAADCLVLPSDHGETWGLVVNEAMACGRPAIVSDQVGCAQDLIYDGDTGTVFHFGDWEQLASILARYASAAVDLSRMGRAAQQRMQAYSPARAADGIERAVEYCLGNSPNGAPASTKNLYSCE